MVRIPPWVLCALVLCCACMPLRAEKPVESLQLPGGARVGVVNLVDPEVTHFHFAPHLENSYLKTYTLAWPVSAMLVATVRDPLTQAGLVVVPLNPGDELLRARERCFLNAALAKGLPKECVPLYTRVATAEHLSALIVLGPGRNDSSHAGSTRHKELPEYLRGFSFVTAEDTPDSPPMLLDLTELLLVRADSSGAELVDREWGGNGMRWSGYQPPANLKAIPGAQLDQLQALYSLMLKHQAEAALGHLSVAR
jgi:hypothetical protein